MWIRTVDGKWYVFEVRGVVHLSWVQASDKAHAAVFPEDKIDDWVKLLGDMAEVVLEAVEPHI